MVDFLQQIIQFLNINCNIVKCYYPDPFEGLFYLVLLPTVLLILLIWFISDGVLSRIGKAHKGVSLLIAAVVYIYIVIQELYTMFVSLGQVWIILVIIVGIIWFAVRMIFGRGGGGAMPGFRGMPSGGGKTRTFLKKVIKGKTGRDEDINSKRDIIKSLFEQLKKSRESGSEMQTQGIIREITRELGNMRQMIIDYKSELESGAGGSFFAEEAASQAVKKHIDDYNDLINKFGKIGGVKLSKMEFKK